MDALRGLNTPPWLVGLTRGLVEAVVLALLGALTLWLSGKDVPDELKAMAPILLLVIRTLEGLADNIDPEKAEPGAPDAV